MPQITNEYQKKVLDDLKNYDGISHPVKAALWERLLIHKVPAADLHPNPVDEFSDPEIGPNYTIVKNYFEMIENIKRHPGAEPLERIVVEKMSVGGYMILNGHHRWLAASRYKDMKVGVDIVNVTQPQDIKNAIEKSNNIYCAAIDLDEVLMCDGNETGRELIFPLKLFYPGFIRKNSSELIKELQHKGFDVWVYTGSYHSAEHIKALLGFHNIHVTGIINGVKSKKKPGSLFESFKKKYKVLTHIDTESVTWVDVNTKDYDIIEVSSGNEWANQVANKLKERLKQ
ncbi:MAG: hypothetical protein K6A23_14030 [Butyrivibrio sp.]|nr:hypothetical protein [Butyrivibrio sp.]